MPKNQSTAAQSARQASRSGGKYTEALRRATISNMPHVPHVLRFLAERSGNHYQVVGGIAAAGHTADSGSCSWRKPKTTGAGP
ncbi:hypothetical protein [Streptomyces chartreusis]|uniref:hypothetical protein n=1 Tax=Streptomyces chartreusis TaxID=1969 RepID=UPI002F90C8CF|nr:hypothetical protein OG938_44030 [Streptomyces chartreusis]WSZ73473.1 hypothetical protein OG938_47765 [Streptomyces chartreusis]WTA33733.1 hypothetical protein OIA45_48370 [Streptomyces chartreusis]